MRPEWYNITEQIRPKNGLDLWQELLHCPSVSAWPAAMLVDWLRTTSARLLICCASGRQSCRVKQIQEGLTRGKWVSFSLTHN